MIYEIHGIGFLQDYLVALPKIEKCELHFSYFEGNNLNLAIDPIFLGVREVNYSENEELFLI